MVQGACRYLSEGILLCLHPDCSANCCTYVSVLQPSLKLDARMCSNVVFMELCAMWESACTHHFKRSLQPSQRDYRFTERNKICSPCFERWEPPCNYKPFFFPSYLFKCWQHHPSACNHLSAEKPADLLKNTCWHSLDIQKPFCVHVHTKDFSFIHLSLDYLIALSLKNMELIFFIGVVLGELFWPKC